MSGLTDRIKQPGSPMYLMTPFYLDTNEDRQLELEYCLERNLSNDWISKIFLFVDETITDEIISPFRGAKLEVVDIGRRCKYVDFMEFANKLDRSPKIIIANSDIFFDNSLEALADYELDNQFFAITRWDVYRDSVDGLHSRLFKCLGSADTWVFKPPLLSMNCDFDLGIPGCDNRLAFEARKAGLKVINPALTIHTHHLHISGVRHSSRENRINKPYLSILPTPLADRLNVDESTYLLDDGSKDSHSLQDEAASILANFPVTVGLNLELNFPYFDFSLLKETTYIIDVNWTGFENRIPSEFSHFIKELLSAVDQENTLYLINIKPTSNRNLLTIQTLLHEIIIELLMDGKDISVAPSIDVLPDLTGGQWRRLTKIICGHIRTDL